jgi:hypothetical protein
MSNTAKRQKNINIRGDQKEWLEQVVERARRRHGISSKSQQVSENAVMRAIMDGVMNSDFDVSAYGTEDKLRKALEARLIELAQ